MKEINYERCKVLVMKGTKHCLRKRFNDEIFSYLVTELQSRFREDFNKFHPNPNTLILNSLVKNQNRRLTFQMWS